ncbi:SgcJ/EcaC family oxidoreductase [Chryseobacterium sp.]|uniref:SgcJ/EcaC family oxidoreductase n=1 Tax=Chryseobacterium sp. TaxID=1871047 RepID=UPI0031CE0200
MKNFYLLVPLYLMISQCSSPSEDYFADRDLDIKEVKRIISTEEVSWNKGDAENYSLYFDRNGVFTNILGQHFVGHSQFLLRHEQIFKGVFKNTVMEQNIITLEFVQKDVVIVETFIKVSGFSGNNSLFGVYVDEDGFLKTRLLQVLRKEKEGWKIVAYHNVDIKNEIH